MIYEDDLEVYDKLKATGYSNEEAKAQLRAMRAAVHEYSVNSEGNKPSTKNDISLAIMQIKEMLQPKFEVIDKQFNEIKLELQPVRLKLNWSIAIGIFILSGIGTSGWFIFQRLIEIASKIH